MQGRDGEVSCSCYRRLTSPDVSSPTTLARLNQSSFIACLMPRKLAWVLKKELDYKKIEEFYWTDSKVVLGSTNNESRRFRTYVANRVQLIHELTVPSQWMYVDSSSNPADEGSRGLTVQQFLHK